MVYCHSLSGSMLSMLCWCWEPVSYYDLHSSDMLRAQLSSMCYHEDKVGGLWLVIYCAQASSVYTLDSRGSAVLDCQLLLMFYNAKMWDQLGANSDIAHYIYIQTILQFLFVPWLRNKLYALNKKDSVVVYCTVPCVIRAWEESTRWGNACWGDLLCL